MSKFSARRGEKIIGVRIVLLRKCIRVDLKNVLRVILIQTIQLILVPDARGVMGISSGALSAILRLSA